MQRIVARNAKLALAIFESNTTSRQLAIDAGIHFTTLSRVLNGWARPKPATARRIAVALGTSPAKLGFTEGEATR